MEKSENIWINFYHTGNITDYLKYKKQITVEELKNGTAITDNNRASDTQPNAAE